MKLDQAVQNEVEKHPHTPGSTRVGVVFVHGIGEQRESETVREFGGALLGWLQEWHKRRRLDVTVKTSNLTYGEDDERPARFSVSLPEWQGRPAQTWILTEAWWASRLDPPGFVQLAGWGWSVLWDNVARLGANFRDKYSTPQDEPTQLRVLSALIALPLIVGIGSAVFTGEILLTVIGVVVLVVAVLFLRLLIEGSLRIAAGRPTPTPPQDGNLPPIARNIGAMSSFLLQLCLAAAIVIGYPFIALLSLLAQIPIPQLQQFILFQTLRVFLVSRIGDFYTFMYDDVQAVHIRNTVPYAIKYLKTNLGCEAIVVIAHSQGTVVAFDALTSGMVDEIGNVKTFVTFGTALEPAWKLAPPRTTRLVGDLPQGIRWVDFWSAFDNVSGAPARSPQGRHQPDESIEVTNSLSIVTDHGDYFTNAEEFLSRLAQEVEKAAGYPNSRFDPGAADAKTWRIRRRDRIFTMVGWRSLAILGMAGALAYRVFWPGDRLRKDGETLWGALSQIAIAGDALKSVDQALSWVAPLEPGLARLAGLAVWSAIFVLFYSQSKRYLFGNWQARESDESTGAKAPPVKTRGQRRQIWLRSVPAAVLFSSAALMIASISPLAACPAAWGCDWVFVGVALLLFAVIAATVDEIVLIRSERLESSAILRRQVIWWLWAALIVFITLVFLIGPWAVAMRMAPGPLPETLFLAPPQLSYDLIQALSPVARDNYEAALWLDLLFPVFYVAALGSTVWFAARKGIVRSAAGIGLVAILLTGVSDIVENILLLRLFDASTAPEWLPLLTAITSLKRLFGVVFIGSAAAIPVVLGSRVLGEWVWDRVSVSGAVLAWTARRAKVRPPMA